MSKYFTEELEYQWNLICETTSSQKFEVDIIDDQRSVKAIFDIHYTRPNTVHVSACFIGEKCCFTDGLCHWVFHDLEKIVKRNGAYRIIDSSLTFAPVMFGRSFPIEY